MKVVQDEKQPNVPSDHDYSSMSGATWRGSGGIAEFAGLEFAGLENDGLENDGLDVSKQQARLTEVNDGDE